MPKGANILFVPGLRDHVADHWQTLLAAELPGSRTVEPLREDRLSCAARVAALDAAIAAMDEPPILVAHSAGCLMVAHWAREHRRPVRGALLATPPDLAIPLPAGYPTMVELEAGGWLPTPLHPLRFESIVVGSTNDPLASAGRAAFLARCWTSTFVVAGDVGHLNPAAGFGPWPQALDHIAALEQACDA